MKWILSLSLLLNVCLCVYVVGSHSDPFVVTDVTPPQHVIEKPVDENNVPDLIARANAQIDITRLYDWPYVKIKASDTYKSTMVTDMIIPPMKRHTVLGGVGVNHDFEWIYAVGYLYSINDSLGCGGYAAFNTRRLESINALLSWRH